MDYSSFSYDSFGPRGACYANDIVHVLCSTRRDEVENKLEEWVRAMGSHGGGWVSVEKTRIPEVQWRLELGWELGYQSTGREFGKCELYPFPPPLISCFVG